MTKGDLIAAVADQAGLTKKAAGDAVQAFIAVVTGSLKKGDPVTVTGFGTFKVSARAARTAVNPQNPTGPKIPVPAHNVPAFKAGKNLKEAVN